MDPTDSVPIDGGPGAPGLGSHARMTNMKLLLALFLIFIFVVSDVFTNNVIAGFGDKAVRCRTPTSWGIILQGIFLVIFYALAIYLAEQGVL
jgi:hypothetical protein